MPAIFVRFAGCNLRCYFCDTDFESSTWHPTAAELLEAIEKAREDSGSFGAWLVVLTGGEPMRQPIAPLIHRLQLQGYMVQIETAGTIWHPSFFDHDLVEAEGMLTWVCSPKTGTVNPRVVEVCHDYKYIVGANDCDPTDGLPCYSTQEPGRQTSLYRPDRRHACIWVQPRAEYARGKLDPIATKLNTDHAVRLSLQYGYRLSLQTHRMLGLD
jgi:organic radical activating enzyme